MSPQPERAVRVKEKGNKLFKNGHLEESAKCYAEAEKLDPTNPVFPSNLSAALYELGDYLGCMDAIVRSWSLQPESALASKLSIRLPKALCQGIHSGTILPSDLEANASVIRELEEIPSINSEEHVQAWMLLRRVRSKLDHHDALAREAKVRFSRMPIYKGTPDQKMLYWQFGMDEIISLVDGWGPDDQDPVKIQVYTKKESMPLAFLIAGVGDARHAFGTVIGIGKTYERLQPQQRKNMNAHVTLLDIHFATIARDLLLCMLIDCLAQGELDADAHLEVQTTLVYVYVGWAMPKYCEARLMGVIQDLISRLSESPSRLPSWLHVDKNSIKAVLRALNIWSSAKSISTTKFLSNFSTYNPTERLDSLGHLNLESFGPSFDPLQSHRENATRALDNLTDEELLNMGSTFEMPHASPAEVREMIELNKELIVKLMVNAKLDRNLEWGLENEAAWYKIVKVFMPPAKLRHLHPGFDYFLQISGGDTSELQLKQIAKNVHKCWKPNITLLDGTNNEQCYEYNAMGIVQQIALFNKQYGIRIEEEKHHQESPTLSYTMAFFDAVVHAVKTLGPSLQLEFICGEVNQELAKIRLLTDSRPTNFPMLFTRIWLSNIPDYTNGTLNTAIYVIPALQDTSESAVSSNCMWNTAVWKSDDEFCYNYTLLLPKDLLRYLGIQTLNDKAVMEFLTFRSSQLPRPLSALASRDELHAWLIRLFMATVSPGRSQRRPNFVKLPNTLVVLVALLGELKNIGYPSHCLADFVQAVISDNIVTDRPIYRESIPRPVSELAVSGRLHRIRVDPWLADLEVILASSLDGLPFAFQMPTGFATNTGEIGHYEASIEANMFYTNPMVRFPENDAVLALLFYQDAKILDARASTILNFFFESIPSIIDGQATPPPGTFHILTSIDFIDLKAGVVRWRISKAKMAKMRRERWSMVAWRTDFFVATTEASPASRWENIDAPV